MGRKETNMANAKKKNNEAVQKLKADLASGELGCAYIFHGEESYLREHYLEEIRKKLVPAGFEEFNYHKVEGKDLSITTLPRSFGKQPPSIHKHCAKG